MLCPLEPCAVDHLDAAARELEQLDDPVAVVEQAHVGDELDRRADGGDYLYCFFDQVVGNPEADVEAIADTLFRIWARPFLLSDPPPVRGAGPAMMGPAEQAEACRRLPLRCRPRRTPASGQARP